MKKVVCLISLALGASTFAANAQENSLLVYGNVGFGTEKSPDDFKSKSFNFDLGVGYQFHHNWTVGLTGGYGTDRSKADNQKNWSLDDQYRIAPFVRFTQPVNKIFAFWLQAEVGGFGGYTGTTANSDRDDKYSGMYAAVTPAVAVYFAPGWALNFNMGGLGYSSTKYDGISNTDQAFAVTLGSQFNWGISKNINCKPSGFKKHRNAEANQDGYEEWKRNRKNND